MSKSDDTELDAFLHANGIGPGTVGYEYLMNKVAALVARREALATEYYQIKLEAVAMRHYQGSKWEPKVGDWYTIDRNDLEFFEIVDEDEDFFYFEPRTPGHSGRSKSEKVGFTDKDFGVHRCKVMDYRKAALTTEATQGNTGDSNTQSETAPDTKSSHSRSAGSKEEE